MKRLLRKFYRKVKRLFINPGKFDHLKVGIKCSCRWYGNQYGGFYLNPNLIHKDSIIYSFGIGEDISFDKELINVHNCQVYGFDPTPKSIKWCKEQVLLMNFHLYDFGISQETGKFKFHLPKNNKHISGSVIEHDNVSKEDVVEVEMKSFVDIVKSLGHDRVDVVKMDIEGSEYHVIESILLSGIQVDQIAVELHERFFHNGKERSMQLINKLYSHGYKMCAVSSSCQEVTFIRKDILKASKKL